MIYASGHMDKNSGRTFMRQLEVEAAGPNKRPNTAMRPRSMEEMMRLAGGTTRVSGG